MIRVLAATLILLSAPALAHLAQSGWVYPGSCCNTRDCRALSFSEIQPTPDGYYIPALDETVPYSAANTSPDGSYHVCVGGGEVTPYIRKLSKPQQYMNRSVVCFWAPEGAV